MWLTLFDLCLLFNSQQIFHPISFPGFFLAWSTKLLRKTWKGSSGRDWSFLFLYYVWQLFSCVCLSQSRLQNLVPRASSNILCSENWISLVTFKTDITGPLFVLSSHANFAGKFCHKLVWLLTKTEFLLNYKMEQKKNNT